MTVVRTSVVASPLVKFAESSIELPFPAVHLGNDARVRNLNNVPSFSCRVDGAARFPELGGVRFIGDDEQTVTISQVEFHSPTLEHILQGRNFRRFVRSGTYKTIKTGFCSFVGSVPARSCKIRSLGVQFNQRLHPALCTSAFISTLRD